MSLAHVLAGDLVVALDDVVLLAVGVDDAGERGLEAGLVHAALGGVDIVCEGDEGLLIAVVVLQGELRDGLALRAGEVDHVLVHGGLVLVEVAHILADAALVAEDVPLLPALALVADVDGEAGVQKGLLAHAGVQHVVVVDDLVEHLGVGLEAHGGAVAVGLAEHMDGLDDLAAGELHAVALSLLVDLDLEPLAQRVDDRSADAVQAAGDLVAAAAELAAGVQHGEHDLEGAFAGLLLDVHGDAAAVVADADDVALLDDDLDGGAEARQSLVDGVVHDLVDQMVQAGGRGRADIHARPFAHGLQALEDLDLRGVILLRRFCFFHFDIVCHKNLRSEDVFFSEDADCIVALPSAAFAPQGTTPPRPVVVKPSLFPRHCEERSDVAIRFFPLFAGRCGLPRQCAHWVKRASKSVIWSTRAYASGAQ